MSHYPVRCPNPYWERFDGMLTNFCHDFGCTFEHPPISKEENEKRIQRQSQKERVNQ